MQYDIVCVQVTLQGDQLGLAGDRDCRLAPHSVHVLPLLPGLELQTNLH